MSKRRPQWKKELDRINATAIQINSHKALIATRKLARIQRSHQEGRDKASNPFVPSYVSKLEQEWERFCDLFPSELSKASTEDDSLRCVDFWAKLSGKLVAIQVTVNPEKPLVKARKTYSGMASLRPAPDVKVLVIMPEPQHDGDIITVIREIARLPKSGALVTINRYTKKTYLLNED